MPASPSAPVAVPVQWQLTGGAAGVCAVVAAGAELLSRALLGAARRRLVEGPDGVYGTGSDSALSPSSPTH
ncbi:hypothetical protein ABT115_12185 [Streptomyces sp. NPDC001832]|uniref:hypothetical protein n=1 Tax=Streptomyces sp. NPDC001832 TaxID=3154527 RepID=UPI00331D3980